MLYRSRVVPIWIESSLCLEKEKRKRIFASSPHLPSSCYKVRRTLHLHRRSQKFLLCGPFSLHRQCPGEGCCVSKNKCTLVLLLLWRSLIRRRYGVHGVKKFVPYKFGVFGHTNWGLCPNLFIWIRWVYASVFFHFLLACSIVTLELGVLFKIL